MTVGELCSKAVVTADPDETIPVAARRMRDRHVGALVVSDGTNPIGVLTDRDIVVSAVAQSPDRLDVLLVRDVMTRDLVTARANEPIEEALRRMRARGVRRLPVVAGDGRIEGLIALDDILDFMADELTQLAGLVAREQKVERTVRR